MMRKEKKEIKTNQDSLKNQNNQPLAKPFDRLPNEILSKIGSYLNPKQTNRVVRSCQFFSTGILQSDLNKYALRILSQAILHDERETVKKILDSNPGLLRLSLKTTGMNEIQSQFTRQTFTVSDLKPFELAVITRQCNLVELMQSYLIKLENGQEEAKNQWARADEVLKKQKKHYDFSNLIDAIKTETGKVGKLSKATEAALQTFRDKLLPKQAIALPEYYDILQVLIHAYQAYDEAFDDLNYEKCRIFSINVIGFIQSLLSPEDAKVFCQGLYDVVEGGKKIGQRAASLKLLDNMPFYSLGLGCKYYMGSFVSMPLSVHFGCRCIGCRGVVEKLCKAKTTERGRLKKELLRSPKSVSAPKRCLIC